MESPQAAVITVFVPEMLPGGAPQTRKCPWDPKSQLRKAIPLRPPAWKRGSPPVVEAKEHGDDPVMSNSIRPEPEVIRWKNPHSQPKLAVADGRDRHPDRNLECSLGYAVRLAPAALVPVR